MASRCAACTYFRRRCQPDCIFAPYFPPNDPERFEMVHALFGARNVAKLLKELEENQKGEAMNSMYFEARTRLLDPVHGCTKIIANLRQQIREAEVELVKINAAVAFFVHQANQGNYVQQSEASSSNNHPR